MSYPKNILHWINNKEVKSASGLWFDKINPATDEIISQVARGNQEDVESALSAAQAAFEEWQKIPVLQRSDILRKAALLLKEKEDEIAEIISLESGKPKKEARNEVNAAVGCGLFFAGEGRRYYGQTLTSSVPNRFVYLIRQSIGVGVLFTPVNNPLANIAWKTFPALLCGNTVIIKSHEITPYSAIWFAGILQAAGVPGGVFSVIQGLGSEAGSALISDERVKFVSCTGSARTGGSILKQTAERLVKVSIEAGGKNPIVVCDDSNLSRAVDLSVSSAFIDAGQRCAAASRIIVFESVYDKFKELFVDKVKKIKVGVGDDSDYGAIFSKEKLFELLQAVEQARNQGATVLIGGRQLRGGSYGKGFFMEPTVLENVLDDNVISQVELFGPVVILYRVNNLSEALTLANNSPYKLSGAIHTASIDRAQAFIAGYQAGVVRVNGPTYGSEPHMPFGGLGLSGNGWREPGEKALDFYSEWKQVSIDYNPETL